MEIDEWKKGLASRQVEREQKEKALRIERANLAGRLSYFILDELKTERNFEHLEDEGLQAIRALTSHENLTIESEHGKNMAMTIGLVMRAVQSRLASGDASQNVP